MSERPPEANGPPELLAATEEPVVLVGDRVSVRLAVPPSTQPRLAAAPVEARLALVVVDEIAAERDPGFVYAVFLNLPDSASEAESRSSHVGNVSLFGIQHVNDPDRAHEGVAPGLRHSFDATDVIRSLYERNLWDPELVTITFQPVRVLPPPGEETLWASVALADEPSIPVTIGRVSFFVA